MKEKMVRKDILSMMEEYTPLRPLYEEYTEKIKDLIKSLLEELEFEIHSVTSRTKAVDDFAKKARRLDKNYEKISDITDLSGVRIICYLSGHVDEVAAIIRNNFRVHPEFSIDKRSILDPDRFGYLSLHYVVELSEDRTRLLEYRRFENLLCEVQIRSILQHAWAEIEHDLGYKSPIEVPRTIRRRFFRLAGLLELADDEFEDIKRDIAQYIKTTKEIMASEPEKVHIDRTTLTQYLNSSKPVEEIGKAIADFVEGDFIKVAISENAEAELKRLQYFNLSTIAELDEAFRGNKEDIIAFGKVWLKDLKGELHISPSEPLSLLTHYMAASTQNKEKILGYVELMVSEEYSGDLASKISIAYKQMSN